MDDTPIPGFPHLVRNPERLGGKATIRGTRFSVSFILACLADFAAEITDRDDVAA